MLLENGKNLVAGIFNGVVDAVKDIGTWIKEKIFQPFIDGFKKAFGIASPSKEMETMGGYIIDGLKNGLGNIWEKVKEKFESLLTGIKDWFSEKKAEFQEAWDTAIEGIGTVVATVKENYEEFKDGLKAKWDAAVDGIESFTSSVKEGYEAFKGGLKTTWSTAVDGIKSFTANVSEGYEFCKSLRGTEAGCRHQKNTLERFLAQGKRHNRHALQGRQKHSDHRFRRHFLYDRRHDCR